ncbi:6337_t:CDS:1, partial [Dentiscutata heterogama]
FREAFREISDDSTVLNIFNTTCSKFEFINPAWYTSANAPLPIL